MTAKAYPPQSRRASWARAFFRILCVLAVLSLVAAKVAGYRPLTTGGRTIGLVEGLALVGYAGVGLPGAAYSNAREALDAAAERGFHMVEVDLLTNSYQYVLLALAVSSSPFIGRTLMTSTV